MKKFLYLLISISVVFASCSGKKYGHYRYSKKKKTKVAKIERHTKKKPETISAKKPNYSCFMTSNKIAVNDSLQLQQPFVKRNKGTVGSALDKGYTLIKRQKLNEDEKVTAKPKNDAIEDDREKNSMANTAFILSLVTLGITLVGIAIPPLLILAAAAGLTTFILATIALKQIGDAPERFSNKNKALFAIIIGSIYLVSIIIAALILLVFLLVILSLR